MDLSPGRRIRPPTRTAAPRGLVSTVGRLCILWTITFAFPAEIGLVLLFKPVQSEAVLSFTSLAPLRVCAVGGAR